MHSWVKVQLHNLELIALHSGRT